MDDPRTGPATGVEVLQERLEEEADVLGIQADEDGVRLEEEVDGLVVAVAGDLFEEDGGIGVQVVVRDLLLITYLCKVLRHEENLP